MGRRGGGGRREKGEEEEDDDDDRVCGEPSLVRRRGGDPGCGVVGVVVGRAFVCVDNRIFPA